MPDAATFSLPDDYYARLPSYADYFRHITPSAYAADRRHAPLRRVQLRHIADAAIIYLRELFRAGFTPRLRD